MPEWLTPLLRVLVAMPSLGYCSTRKTSCQRCETAWAMAQPTTPPPIIKMLAWSTGLSQYAASKADSELRRLRPERQGRERITDRLRRNRNTECNQRVLILRRRGR